MFAGIGPPLQVELPHALVAHGLEGEVVDVLAAHPQRRGGRRD